MRLDLWFKGIPGPPREMITTPQFCIGADARSHVGLIRGPSFSEEPHGKDETEVEGMLRLHLHELTRAMRQKGMAIPAELEAALDHQIDGSWSRYYHEHPPTFVISDFARSSALCARWKFSQQAAIIGVTRNRWVAGIIPIELTSIGGGMELRDL